MNNVPIHLDQPVDSILIEIVKYKTTECENKICVILEHVENL